MTVNHNAKPSGTAFFRKAIISAVLVLNLFYAGAAFALDKDTLFERAQQGDARAEFNLGVMYYKGQGVAQDSKQAFAWFKKAAQQSNANAQFNLGLMYESGQGVAQDNKQAYVLLSLAAIGGGQKAASVRDIVALKLSPQALKEAKAEVRKRTQKP